MPRPSGGAWVWALPLLVGLLPGVAAQGCPSTAGIVLGSIFGTLVVVAIVGVIVYFVLKKKKQREAARTRKATDGARGTYDNPTFEGDLERGRPSGSTNAIPQEKHAEKGFGGYVECREYESPRKNKVVASPETSTAARVLFLEDAKKGGHPIRKAGSRGSLDEAVPPVESDVVFVPLLSQDIMGLGFNIDGNLKKGVYVSQIHKRGPASESGLIDIGDRIIHVTVSFENMVLEDAMTVLSYASPYPVKLCLRKAALQAGAGGSQAAGAGAGAGEGLAGQDDGINHPVFRSQSLDDLRHIGKEGLQHPRRTFSEMKKSG